MQIDSKERAVIPQTPSVQIKPCDHKVCLNDLISKIEGKIQFTSETCKTCNTEIAFLRLFEDLEKKEECEQTRSHRRVNFSSKP